uniref:Uncharacterized protein n=1 Tax=Anguilla anguilla TaxID=7936 RepID=A0A0E9TZY5_ANGAN
MTLTESTRREAIFHHSECHCV